MQTIPITEVYWSSDRRVIGIRQTLPYQYRIRRMDIDKQTYERIKRMAKDVGWDKNES